MLTDPNRPITADDLRRAQVDAHNDWKRRFHGAIDDYDWPDEDPSMKLLLGSAIVLAVGGLVLYGALKARSL